MSNLSTLPKGDSAWLLRKAIERIMEQVSVLETNIGSSTTGNSANTQIIFNDNGTLRGDAGLVYNKTTDTLTAGNATITGDLTVDTTTLVVDATNNRVGIGTATPAGLLVVSGGRTGLFSGDAYSLALARTTAQANYFYLGTDASGNLLLSESGGSAVVTMSQSGNVSIANGNVVMSTSGKGIDFSATASGSGTMTSELLADYEEGTFTPTVGGTISNGTATYGTQTGVYTKIGRIVQIQIFVAWVAGTANGNQTVLGLPFAAHGTANNFSILNTYPIDIALTAGHLATSSIPPNGSVINLYQLPTGGGSDLNVPCDPVGTLIFTGTYTAA